MNRHDLCKLNNVTEPDFMASTDWLYGIKSQDEFNKALKEIMDEQYGHHLNNMQATVVVWKERTGQND